jgi:hypothetical protein
MMGKWLIVMWTSGQSTVRPSRKAIFCTNAAVSEFQAARAGL